MTVPRFIKFPGFYALQADEIGVELTMGKLDGVVQPGLQLPCKRCLAVFTLPGSE